MKSSYCADTMTSILGSRKIARLQVGLQAYLRDTVGSVPDHGNKESHIGAFVSHKTHGYTGPQSIMCAVPLCLKENKCTDLN